MAIGKDNTCVGTFTLDTVEPDFFGIGVDSLDGSLTVGSEDIAEGDAFFLLMIVIFGISALTTLDSVSELNIISR